MKMSLVDASGGYILVEPSGHQSGAYICLPIRLDESPKKNQITWECREFAFAHLTRGETVQLISLLKLAVQGWTPEQDEE